MRLPTGRNPFQKAWVVRDIEQAAARWSMSLNIGPFYLAEYAPGMFDYVAYRGKPGRLHMKTAIAYAGDSQIELVEPLGDAATAYSDVFPAGEGGFHHVCFWSDDIDADVQHYKAQGYAIANEGKMKGGPRFAYVDAMASLGCYIELLERSGGIETLFDQWRVAARRWDGKTAIVRL